MHFRIAASVAVLACASHVAAEPQPYKLAMMPVLGMSLMRRDTGGYKPEQTICGAGDTCDAACGGGYTECPSHDSSIHCFSPAAQQSCCTDGSGNSCDAGYYCTHDSKKETWCCPDGMDLSACAAAYSIKGTLAAATSTSTTSTSTSTSTSTTKKHTTKKHTTKTTTTTEEAYTPTPTPTSTPTPSPISSCSSHSKPSPSTTAPAVITNTGPFSPPPTKTTNAAGSTGVNALALLAAGLVALF